MLRITCMCEELRSSAVETRKHLRLISQRNRLVQNGRFLLCFALITPLSQFRGGFKGEWKILSVLNLEYFHQIAGFNE